MVEERTRTETESEEEVRFRAVYTVLPSGMKFPRMMEKSFETLIEAEIFLAGKESSGKAIYAI